MRGYQIDSKFPGGLYKVAGDTVRRGNKTAAGMSAHAARKRTATRHNPALSPDALGLTVRGTLDGLSGTRFDLGRAACTCCGAKTDKRILTGKPSQTRSRSLRLDPARLP